MYFVKKVISKPVINMNTGPKMFLFIGTIMIMLVISSDAYSQEYHSIAQIQENRIAIMRPPDINVGDRFQIVRLVDDVETVIGEAEVDRISPNYCRMIIVTVEPGYTVDTNDRVRKVTPELEVETEIEEEHKPEEELPIEIAEPEPESEPGQVQEVEREPEPESEPAQEVEPEPKPKPKPKPEEPISASLPAGGGRVPYRAGFRGGITIDATVDYTPDANLSFDEISPNTMVGFAFGALFDIHVWGPLYLDFAPIYSITSSEWEISNNDEKITTNRSFHYLGVTIALKYHIGPFYLLGGVNFFSIMDAGKENSNKDVIIDVKDDLNTSLIAYDAGAGLEYRFSPRMSILVEGRFTITQSNIISDPDEHFEELIPGGFQVLAGVIFDMQRLL